ncbi:hypothetical protein TNCV_3063151 [Trichonephila clavipes]|nr:hypothetical protein TNCV_3063151 [Trichonephila clavipes]
MGSDAASSAESILTILWSVTAPEQKGDRGSLKVKVADWWPVCHEFELSTSEDPLCRGTKHVKSVESSNVLPLEW